MELHSSSTNRGISFSCPPLSFALLLLSFGVLAPLQRVGANTPVFLDAQTCQSHQSLFQKTCFPHAPNCVGDVDLNPRDPASFCCTSQEPHALPSFPRADPRKPDSPTLRHVANEWAALSQQLGRTLIREAVSGVFSIPALAPGQAWRLVSPGSASKVASAFRRIVLVPLVDYATVGPAGANRDIIQAGSSRRTVHSNSLTRQDITISTGGFSRGVLTKRAKAPSAIVSAGAVARNAAIRLRSGLSASKLLFQDAHQAVTVRLGHAVGLIPTVFMQESYTVLTRAADSARQAVRQGRFPRCQKYTGSIWPEVSRAGYWAARTSCLIAEQGHLSIQRVWANRRIYQALDIDLLSHATSLLPGTIHSARAVSLFSLDFVNTSMNLTYGALHTAALLSTSSPGAALKTWHHVRIFSGKAGKQIQHAMSRFARSFAPYTYSVVRTCLLSMQLSIRSIFSKARSAALRAWAGAGPVLGELRHFTIALVARTVRRIRVAMMLTQFYARMAALGASVAVAVWLVGLIVPGLGVGLGIAARAGVMALACMRLAFVVCSRVAVFAWRFLNCGSWTGRDRSREELTCSTVKDENVRPSCGSVLESPSKLNARQPFSDGTQVPTDIGNKTSAFRTELSPFRSSVQSPIPPAFRSPCRHRFESACKISETCSSTAPPKQLILQEQMVGPLNGASAITGGSRDSEGDESADLSKQEPVVIAKKVLRSSITNSNPYLTRSSRSSAARQGPAPGVGKQRNSAKMAEVMNCDDEEIIFVSSRNRQVRNMRMLYDKSGSKEVMPSSRARPAKGGHVLQNHVRPPFLRKSSIPRRVPRSRGSVSAGLPYVGTPIVIDD